MRTAVEKQVHKQGEGGHPTGGGALVWGGVDVN